MPWFSVITERVARNADDHDSHAAQHEVARREAEDEHVRRDQETEADVVPPLVRDRHILEKDLDPEAEEQQPAEVPLHAEQPCVRPARDERDHQRYRDGDQEHQHADNGTRIPSASVAIPEVLYEVDRGVARTTINRPERRNAMSFGVMHGLRDAMARAKADDAARVVVLTGAGDRAFCAGADLVGSGSGDRGIADSAATAHDGRGMLADLFRDMWSLGKPIIARVRGYALAGGFGLACACDLIVAADDAVFGTPEINVGLWPYMITVPLLRSMPPKTALDLMMTGRRVSAEEGARLGFVQRVVPVAGLDAAVDELAASLAGKSPLIMRWGRDSFYRVLEMDADAALSYLQGMLTITSQTEDAAEGVAAFAEKRAPQWKGK